MAGRRSSSSARGKKFVQVTTWIIALIVVLSMVLALLPLGR
jgi:hypothetical protein